MITTKIYNLDFLNTFGIRFDDEVPFAEDNPLKEKFFAKMVNRIE